MEGKEFKIYSPVGRFAERAKLVIACLLIFVFYHVILFK